MTDVDPAYEKHVRLRVKRTTSELVKYAQEVAEEIPGLIDIQFENCRVVFHYNNNGINIDELAEFLQKVNIELEDSLMNKLKIMFHSFVDANAKSNAKAKPGCCAAADEICKTVERNETKK